MGCIYDKAISQGEFLLQYPGELITATAKTVLMPQSHPGPQLGRLVNHDRKEANVKMRVIEVHGRPFLALFALRNIDVDKEILYDYGPKQLPWETKVPSPTLVFGQTWSDRKDGNQRRDEKKALTDVMSTKHASDGQLCL
ncbi:N-lysine methyltransferase KMT5A-like [Glandiceps talaboti]